MTTLRRQRAQGGLGLAPVSSRQAREPLSIRTASGSDAGRPGCRSRAPLVAVLGSWLRAVKTRKEEHHGAARCSVMHKPLAPWGDPQGKGGPCTHGPGLGARRAWLVP